MKVTSAKAMLLRK